MGYAYDIFGRFYMLGLCLGSIALQLAVLPYSAPHFWLLCTFRACLSIFWRAVTVNPLIADYIKNESRGSGISLGAYGYVFGKLIMILMFELTRKMTLE